MFSPNMIQCEFPGSIWWVWHELNFWWCNTTWTVAQPINTQFIQNEPKWLFLFRDTIAIHPCTLRESPLNFFVLISSPLQIRGKCGDILIHWVHTPFTIGRYEIAFLVNVTSRDTWASRGGVNAPSTRTKSKLPTRCARHRVSNAAARLVPLTQNCDRVRLNFFNFVLWMLWRQSLIFNDKRRWTLVKSRFRWYIEHI